MVQGAENGHRLPAIELACHVSAKDRDAAIVLGESFVDAAWDQRILAHLPGNELSIPHHAIDFLIPIAQGADRARADLTQTPMLLCGRFSVDQYEPGEYQADPDSRPRFSMHI